MILPEFLLKRTNVVFRSMGGYAGFKREAITGHAFGELGNSRLTSNKQDRVTDQTSGKLETQC